MFEVNGEYANRKGKYVVLTINSPKMRVRFEDGSEADLNMAIQERIWDNIRSEEEAKAAKRQAKANQGGKGPKHFIKVISFPTEDMNFPGWQERVVMAHKPEDAGHISSGDRLIYYALEAKVFFAVATITGEYFTANPKDYFFKLDAPITNFFPVDTDASVSTLEYGIPYDSMDLETQPNFKKLRLTNEEFLAINEDDFELLAELLTEATEEDEDALADDYADDDL